MVDDNDSIFPVNNQLDEQSPEQGGISIEYPLVVEENLLPPPEQEIEKPQEAEIVTTEEPVNESNRVREERKAPAPDPHDLMDWLLEKKKNQGE